MTTLTQTFQPRVVVADDHPITVRGLVEALRAAGFIVVGDAKDGEALLALVRQAAPDVAIVDVDMPVLDGLGVLRRARAEGLPCRFLMLSHHDARATVKAAFALGAHAYVTKHRAVEELVEAARAVAAGKTWSSAVPTESGPALDQLHASLEHLTPAELRILAMLADSLTSPAIADKLCLSVRTVQNHRAHVCEKLALSGSHSLLRVALENKERILALIRAEDALL
jgi:DNA-binding NarL/FixJ family response regulator